MKRYTGVAVCSACEQTCDTLQTPNYPEQGWRIPFDLFGYRGGFSEEVGALIGNRRSREWILCHDCVVKFLDTFPLLAEKAGLSALHRCEAEKPCCRFAWREVRIGGVRQLFVADKKGERWQEDY